MRSVSLLGGLLICGTTLIRLEPMLYVAHRLLLRLRRLRRRLRRKSDGEYVVEVWEPDRAFRGIATTRWPRTQSEERREIGRLVREC